MLPAIQRWRWLPRVLARLPLRISRKALLENILAIDAQAIDASEVRWGGELERALGHLSLSTSPPVGTVPAEPDLVSIVLPTYNGVRFLRDSIASCLAQSYRNLELIVVDDGSSADVRSVALGFSDERIRYVRHQTNRGIAEGLNTGFRASGGRFLTWTSDDNLFAPDAIETMVRFLRRNPDVAFVFASSYKIDESGKVAAIEIIRPEPQAWLPIANRVGACFLYTREVFEAVGDYDARAFLAEDYDYWLRIGQRFRMQRLLKPLYFYRWHDESLTGKYTPEKVGQQVDFVRSKNQLGRTV